MFDSTLGPRCAPWVVNLDGKSSLASLQGALTTACSSISAAPGSTGCSWRDYHALWFDRFYPQWRRQFTRAGSAGRVAIFARVGAGAKSGLDP
jgi:hypothetical protein